MLSRTLLALLVLAALGGSVAYAPLPSLHLRRAGTNPVVMSSTSTVHRPQVTLTFPHTHSTFLNKTVMAVFPGERKPDDEKESPYFGRKSRFYFAVREFFDVC